MSSENVRFENIGYLIWCKFNNRIVISNIMNNKYTIKKFNVKFRRLSTPINCAINIKIIDRDSLKRVDIIPLIITKLELKFWTNSLNKKSIKILNRII